MESGWPSDGLPTETDLSAVIDRTVTKIESLNTRACAAKAVRALGWTDVSSLNAMIERGILWHLPRLDNGCDPLSLRHEAVELLKGELRAVAIVHGDVHLRNVLVRDGREPFLIDYALAGPGHPCLDLVRFESALMFHFFRMTESECAVRELLIAAGGDAATVDELYDRFPGMCQSLGNRLAIRAAVGAWRGLSPAAQALP